MIDQVITQIKDTLRSHGVDFKGIIEEFGQVRAYEDRRRGKSFTLNEHVRGLILAQLSNQRTWGPIAAQMENMARNIEMFETLVNEFGSVDAFLTCQDPGRIAKELGSGKRYKLKEIAFTLAMEYLRNVDINAIKPDLHICRLIGPQRFGFINK
jgi:preprotein translocase subunit SecD